MFLWGALFVWCVQLRKWNKTSKLSGCRRRVTSSCDISHARMQLTNRVTPRQPPSSIANGSNTSHTISPTVAKRSRDASCLSVVSFHSTIPQPQSFSIGYFRFSFTDAYNQIMFCCLRRNVASCSWRGGAGWLRETDDA